MINPNEGLRNYFPNCFYGINIFHIKYSGAGGNGE